MPQQMRFWELTSAFREWPTMLREVLASPRWRDPYLSQYERLDELVNRQERGTLDALVPLELSREVAAKCPAQFIFDPTSLYVRQPLDGETVAPRFVVMSAVEVHDRFGGSTLEEVHEKGVAAVPAAA